MNIISNLQVAELNDRAALLLIQGKHHEAIHIFKQCSIAIKELLVKYSEDNIDTNHQRHTSPQDRQLSASQTKSSPYGVFSSDALTGLQHDDFFIYNRPCLLAHIMPILESSFDGNKVIIMRVCSAVSIFNMALAFHLRAVNGNQNALTVAEKLYQSVLNLLQDDTDCRFTEVDEILLLITAAANNMSHVGIISQGLCSKMAISSLVRLRNFILPVLTRGERLPFTSEEEWEGICWNVYNLSVPKSLVSAPAA